MVTLQVFDFSRVGAEKAFLHEKAVLQAVKAGQETGAQGAEVLPMLITTSTKLPWCSVAGTNVRLTTGDTHSSVRGM